MASVTTAAVRVYRRWTRHGGSRSSRSGSRARSSSCPCRPHRGRGRPARAAAPCRDRPRRGTSGTARAPQEPPFSTTSGWRFTQVCPTGCMPCGPPFTTVEGTVAGSSCTRRACRRGPAHATLCRLSFEWSSGTRRASSRGSSRTLGRRARSRASKQVEARDRRVPISWQNRQLATCAVASRRGREADLSGVLRRGTAVAVLAGRLVRTSRCGSGHRRRSFRRGSSGTASRASRHP